MAQPTAGAAAHADPGRWPLCWPWFGRQGPDAPAHGLARTQTWQLHAQQPLPDGRLQLVLRPVESLHPLLTVEQVVRIGSTLEQSLVTTNVGDQPFVLTQALHNYFAVEDVAAAEVSGLHDTAYIDALAAGQRRTHSGVWRFAPDRHGGRCDRIHQLAGGPVILQRGPGRRRICLSAQGSAALVLWTPGQALGSQMADVGPHWRDFLCLEVANAGDDCRHLLPGQQHVLTQCVSLLD